MQQKKSTKEMYVKQVNMVVEYIHNHLDENIDLKKLADISCFSPFHFQRIMKAFLKEPVWTFIIRTRVETAARLVRYSDLPIQDIAFKVGYDTPSSLSKIFKQFYGVSPIDYRNNKEMNIIMKPTESNIELNIKAPKIITIDAKQVIYIRLSGDYSSLEFGNTWKKLWGFVKEFKLFSAGIEHICIYYDDPKVTETEKLRTDVCLVIPKKAEPKGEIGVKELKAGKFLKVLYQGPYNYLGQVYDEIYSKYIPEGGYKLRDGFCFEKYINNPERTEPEKLKTEIYVPVE